MPARWFSTSALSFRTNGTVLTEHQAAVGAASGGGVTTIASYASGATGVRQFIPDATNSTAGSIPSVGAAAVGNGWRDDGSAGSLSTAYDYPADSNNGQAFQKRWPTQITGTWTWVVSTAAAPAAQAPGIAATLTIIVYAISAAGADRELFRTSATISAVAVEANTTITATPGTVLLNPDEILQHGLWLNVTAGPTVAGAYTIAFRDGVAGVALTQPSIQEGTAIIAAVPIAIAATSTDVVALTKAVGKNPSVTSVDVVSVRKDLAKTVAKVTTSVPAVTKALAKTVGVVSTSIPSGTLSFPFNTKSISGGGGGTTIVNQTIQGGGSDDSFAAKQADKLSREKEELETLIALFLTGGITEDELGELAGKANEVWQ